jgi:hypothetical protein
VLLKTLTKPYFKRGQLPIVSSNLQLVNYLSSHLKPSFEVSQLLVTPTLESFSCSFEFERESFQGAWLALDRRPSLLDNILKTLKFGPKYLKLKPFLALEIILEPKKEWAMIRVIRGSTIEEAIRELLFPLY